MWSERGIYTLDLLFNEKGLLSFEELRASFDVVGKVFLFYFIYLLLFVCFLLTYSLSFLFFL